ncbi:MAG: hypothetical protein ACI4XM_07520 [Candidatus Coprovivens sp.]
MFDLTLKQDDKDSYIVDVVMNDNGTYTVFFASGRNETYPFSIHNFQVELYRMEEQFELYGKDYLEKIYPNGGIRSGLLAMMLVADVAYLKFILDEGLNFARGWCLGYAIYMLVTRLVPHLKSRKLYVDAKRKIALIKLYLENKDQFKVDVINPHTGDLDEWYLVDMASIDNFKDEDELNNYLVDLTDEVKLQKSEEITLKLNKCVEGGFVK